MVRKATQWEQGFRYRLLGWLGGSLLLCFLLFFVIVYLGLKSDLYSELQDRVEYTRQLREVLIKQRTEVLQSRLEPLLVDSELRAAFLAQDRERLLNIARPLFEPLRADHNITHFYFHTVEGYNYLRVHQPDRYGDRIDRYTMRESAATLSRSHGLELGPLGTFTLRLVAPWYSGSELIGFIELGEDSQPIIDELAFSAGFDMVVLIDKKLLSRTGWQAGMQMLSRESEWDLFPDVALVDETRPGLSLMLKPSYQAVPMDVSQEVSLSMEGSEYLGTSVPLEDVSGNIVGRWYILNDISSRMSDFRQAMGLVLILCLSVGLVLTGMMNAVLRRIEQQLRASQEGLEQLVADRTDELQKALIDTQLSREQIRVVLKSIQDPILVVSELNHVWLANRAVRDLFRFGDRDLSGESLEELVGPEVFRQISQLRPVDSHLEAEIEIKYLRAGKEEVGTFAVQTTSVELGDAGRAHIFLFHDVTRARKMERLKSEFISNAAHELNTPLATIVGYVELLLDPEQNFSAEMRDEFLRTIYGKSNHLGRLLGQLLDISRLEAGRPIPLEIAEIPLQKALHEIVGHMPSIHEKHTFRFEIPEEPLVLSADPDKFQQILENIFSNALKYSPAGGEICLRVAAEDEGLVHFMIRDQGIGMSQEELKHVFDRFYRADASDSATRGVGLGLTITRQLIEAHGGRIWIESTPGEGTSVHVVLPGHVAVKSSQGAEASEGPSSREGQPKPLGKQRRGQ